jgi:hypothetical protein
MDFYWHGQVVDTVTFDTTRVRVGDMGWTYYDYTVAAPMNAEFARLILLVWPCSCHLALRSSASGEAFEML